MNFELIAASAAGVGSGTGGNGDTVGVDTMIVPVFAESLQRMPEGLASSKLLPRMADRHATTWLYGAEGRPDVLFVGLGEAAKYGLHVLRDAAGEAGRALVRENRLTAVLIFAGLTAGRPSCDGGTDEVEAWVEGSLLGVYSFDKYKKDAKARAAATIRLAVGDDAALREAIRIGSIRAESTIWARDLINEPPNRLRPLDLAARVKERFTDTEAQVTLYEGEQLEQMGFAGVTAVGKGSEHPPVFIEVRYCSDSSKPLVALVGKGITFDTGGISLKRDHDISDMRMDMAGAGATLAALDILVRSGASVNAAVLVPAAENSPSGRALLPGEIITYANGLSVQVGNTDSEGRLVLADALIYAHCIGAEQAIDVATLTYSVVGALGTKVAGILGDDELARDVRAAGEPFGERVWQLPLIDEYEAYLASDYADTSNISRVGEAGAITAALFLRKFVHPSLRWAHIDMSGTKEASSAKGQHAVGATGFGARMLAEYVSRMK
ncbi:leucyl aminopeptidase family protein [Cohnella phaseoli]|uniref:Probable cytosol aminopeptidase n=1 Tax=Cohnella phaseoli TaxID=456490 RepID=A0A3D9JQP7_9BACL|nr:leucyl aminopeptidase family protein [Cohnella phaseoli]RED76352.1 leucyl aminopeptidase [Cohnella phaseoli]